MVANQRVQKEMHVVVHVGELERVRERVDATRDKPHRQATATRSARQPDPGAVLSSSASSAVRILSSGAKENGVSEVVRVAHDFPNLNTGTGHTRGRTRNGRHTRHRTQTADTQISPPSGAYFSY